MGTTFQSGSTFFDTLIFRESNDNLKILWFDNDNLSKYECLNIHTVNMAETRNNLKSWLWQNKKDLTLTEQVNKTLWEKQRIELNIWYLPGTVSKVSIFHLDNSCYIINSVRLGDTECFSELG